MDVEPAEESILILPEALSIEQPEGRAWAKRIEAYGTIGKPARASGEQGTHARGIFGCRRIVHDHGEIGPAVDGEG